MRRLYIVSYDIRDDRRLRLVHKVMRGYGDRIQYSVYRCDLSDAERAILIGKLDALIKHDADQVLLLPIGPAGGELESSIISLGLPYLAAEHTAIVV